MFVAVAKASSPSSSEPLSPEIIIMKCYLLPGVQSDERASAYTPGCLFVSPFNRNPEQREFRFNSRGSRPDPISLISASASPGLNALQITSGLNRRLPILTEKNERIF